MTDKHKKIVWIIAVLIFIAVLALITVFVGGPMIKLAEDPDAFRAWLDGIGFWGKAAFVGMVVLQVLVAFIPGEPIELAAGYIFGFWEGSFLTLLGFLIGSWMVFALVRKFGVKLVEVFFSKEQMDEIPEESQKDPNHQLDSHGHSGYAQGYAQLFCRFDQAYYLGVAGHRCHWPDPVPGYIHFDRCGGRRGELSAFGDYIGRDPSDQPGRHPILPTYLQTGKRIRKSHRPRSVGFWFLLFVFRHLQGGSQLIGAGGSLAAAGGTFQTGDHIVNIHAFHQGADALEIAVAAAQKFHMGNLAVFYIEADLTGAGTFGLVSITHIAYSFQ